MVLFNRLVYVRWYIGKGRGGHSLLPARAGREQRGGLLGR